MQYVYITLIAPNSLDERDHNICKLRNIVLFSAKVKITLAFWFILVILLYVCDVLADVDECFLAPGLCDRDGLCANTIGSYTCSKLPSDTCPPGYNFDMPLQSCLGLSLSHANY